jgi:hypothetical protein
MGTATAGLSFNSGTYSERLFYINIGNAVMAGSRKVLFQAATNKLQKYQDGTQAS